MPKAIQTKKEQIAVVVDCFVDARDAKNRHSREERAAQKLLRSLPERGWESKRYLVTLTSEPKLKFDKEKFIEAYGLKTYEKFLTNQPEEKWTITKK